MVRFGFGYCFTATDTEANYGRLVTKLTPANQLMVMGRKISSMFNLGFEPGIFRSLAQRAYQLRYPGPLNNGIKSQMAAHTHRPA
jgi:hypothetical protein